MQTSLTIERVYDARKHLVGYDVPANTPGAFFRVSWSQERLRYQCSCGQRGCEHIQAVSGLIAGERQARVTRDKEIATLHRQSEQEQEREAAMLAECKAGEERRLRAPLGNNGKAFSLMR